VIKKRSLIIGGTGLIGGEILKILDAQNEDIILFSRCSVKLESKNIKEYLVDFDNLEKIKDIPRVDNVYISIGTRLDVSELLYIKKRARKEFSRVDLDLVLNSAKKAFSLGARSIAIVSAIGANRSSKNLYLKTKGVLEEEIKKIGYEKVVIAQPGHLLGERPGEKIRIEISAMEFIAKILEPLMIGPIKPFRSIEAINVADSMVRSIQDGVNGVFTLRFDDFNKG
tara:strand:+ start:699 stop:1376 length:678 start_codon:yes stop_codon:yes gene_type:complete